jgi:hypothetical protein
MYAFTFLFRFEHPSVRPLLLTAINECECEKLICTFIRPTVLPYSRISQVSPPLLQDQPGQSYPTPE